MIAVVLGALAIMGAAMWFGARRYRSR